MPNKSTKYTLDSISDCDNFISHNYVLLDNAINKSSLQSSFDMYQGHIPNEILKSASKEIIKQFKDDNIISIGTMDEDGYDIQETLELLIYRYLREYFYK